MIEFTIPITPVAKQGDRVRVVQPKTGKPFAMHYTPPEVKANAEAMANHAARHRPHTPLQGPVAVELAFHFPWLKKHTKSQRSSVDRVNKDTKPDLDNLQKQVLDVLQACGFYVNDSQVARLTSDKTHEHEGGVDVRMWELK